MSAVRPSVFDALASESRLDDPLEARLVGDFAERLAAQPDALARLLDDFRAAGYGEDVRAWLAPGQSAVPPPLPPEAIERVAQLGHVLDTDWIAAEAARNSVDTSSVTRRLGALIPGAVKVLTPRGEVPTARALAIGLDGLRRRAIR